MSARDTEAVAREVARIFEEAEQRVLRVVARRLARGIEDPGWAEKKLAEMQHLRREVRAIIASLARSTPIEVRRQLLQIWRESQRAAAAQADALGVQSLSAAFGTGPRINMAAVILLAEQTVSTLEGTHLRILRAADDVYRKAVAAGAAQVVAGAATRRAATQSILDRFAASGVTGFVDTAGRSWSLSSYAEMATRTGALNVMRDAKMGTWADMGLDLVYIITGPEPCPSCAEYDGVVLSMNGTSPGYQTVDEATSESHLFGPNCGCDEALYVEGLSKPGERSAPYSAERYEDRMQQRYLERGIRQWKMRQAGALDDAAAARKAAAKTAEWQARLRQHVATKGRKRLRYREQIGRAV